MNAAAILLRRKETIEARLEAIRVEHMDLMIELREIRESVEELTTEKQRKAEADTLVDGRPFDGGHAPRTLDEIVDEAEARHKSGEHGPFQSHVTPRKKPAQ